MRQTIRMFSWEKPIEQEILEFVTTMEKQWDTVAYAGQKEVREGAFHYRDAYRIVREYIEKEIKLRNSMSNTNKEKGQVR